MDRVGVFIDYENMHRVAHALYADAGLSRHETVLDPLRVARRIVANRRLPSELRQVRVYRGRPVPEFQPEAAGANDKLANAWLLDGVDVVRRDLKYVFRDNGTWLAQEKGIDVALAVGVVHTAMKRDIDVAIVFSNDTDQLPAVELVFHQLEPRIEIACWSTAKPLWFPDMLRAQPPRRLPFCHFLDADDFTDCRDYRGRLDS